jgi:hypothetical protein
MFELKKMEEKVYCIIADDAEDLAMLFIRPSEFYESDEGFKGKNFLIKDVLDLSRKNSGIEYHERWAGFNFPVQSILDYGEIKDNRFYDDIMKGIALFIESKDPGSYLIGVKRGSKLLIHEISHGLYFSNNEYREKVLAILNELHSNIVDILKKSLKDLGYCKDVYLDEMQAWLISDDWNFNDLEDKYNLNDIINRLKENYNATATNYKISNI